jgi:hypothetical protein
VIAIIIRLIRIYTMKKNYIANLQEYEAKTTPTAKLNHYRKKFSKTVYQNDK